MAAISAKVLPALLETTRGTPAAAAARAMATSPSGSAARCSVIGATPTGSAEPSPSSVHEVSTSRTSRSTCGATRIERHACVASRSVTSSRAPSLDVAEHRLGQGVPCEGLHLVEPRGPGHRPQPSSTPARFFLPRRSTSQEPASRSSSPGTCSTSVIALVVQVGAALGDGAARIALALDQPGLDEQVDDAGAPGGTAWRRPPAGRRPGSRAGARAGLPRRRGPRRRPWRARSPPRRGPRW